MSITNGENGMQILLQEQKNQVFKIKPNKICLKSSWKISQQFIKSHLKEHQLKVQKQMAGHI